jgi:hypothetical protein
MNRSISTLLFACALAALSTASTEAQNGLNVFLDCHRMWCERDHFRREIPYVNWVRDRMVADVHILGTSQETGGGREFIFTFIGLREYDGHADTLRFSTSRTDVRDEQRDGQTRTLQMGLMRFLSNSPVAQHIDIVYTAPIAVDEIQARPEDDPWNFWIFTVGGNGSVDAESLEQTYRFGANVSARRTTDDWRLWLYARGDYREQRFEYEDIEDSVAVYNNSTYRAQSHVIRKVGEHWGVGVRGSIGNSIRSNQDLYVRAASGIEYSIFPYSESTRRSFTILYGLGIAGFDYEEVTIFDKTTEILLEHGLAVAVDYVQPWGNVGADLEAIQFLHDLESHRVELGIGLSVRVVRGLRFTWGGSVARIRDQIFLSGAGVPQDEILLRRRARGTDFEIGIGFGFSYSFGSIFNNAVNPAMDEFR